MTRQNFDKVKALIDAANNEDPNQEICEDKILPKDLLFIHTPCQICLNVIHLTLMMP